MADIFGPLLSAPILFFMLGVFAAAVRSDLSMPETLAKGMSLYLMAAIGLKGGVQVAKAGLSVDFALAALAGVVFSALVPMVLAAALRTFGRVDRLNSGAIAAHYGSVSVVTFVTASQIYGANGAQVAGFMVAVLAMMETPAILSGLWIARGKAAGSGVSTAEMLREVLFNGSVVLLIGSFAIGVAIGPDGYAPIAPVFTTGFTGILCLFLLDMGLVAARRVLQSRSLTLRLSVLAIVFPLINGTLGVAAGTLIGLDVLSAAAFGILVASASYIAVPAAMRLSLPQADAGLSLAMALGITFPFNIIVGIPLFRKLAEMMGA